MNLLGAETVIGYTDVKSAPVYFFARARDTAGGKIVTYNAADVNVGGGLNETTGIFTAPKSGNYFVSVVGLGLATKADSQLYVSLIKGDTGVLNGYCTPGTNHFLFCTFAMQGMVALQAGDSVYVYNAVSSLNDAGVVRGQYTQFNGWLIQENLFKVLP